MKKMAVLGLARSGIAVAYKIKKLGGNPFLSELRSSDEIPNASILKQDFECEFGGHTEKLYNFDTFIISPGIPLSSSIIQELKKRGKELISEIEFGFRIKESSSKIIAITGSNGKSTTVSLIHHILQKAAYHSILAGNIGTAFSSFPIEEKGIELIVLEVSSFQLDLIDSFHAEVAAVLNITPDHMNRYSDLNAYAKSKFRIFENQIDGDVSILNADDPVSQKMIRNNKTNFQYFGKSAQNEIYTNAKKIFYKNKFYSLDKSNLIGVHNLQNTMAAILASAPFVEDSAIIQNAIDSFQALAHRLEKVKQVNGITFFNDSKATNSESVKYALTAFDKPIRIIMGGSDKGETFSNLVPLLKTRATKIYLIGETRPLMRKQFSKQNQCETFSSFSGCVQKAYEDAKEGDIILLSPGCASFDMFENFEDRGDQFKKVVSEL